MARSAAASTAPGGNAVEPPTIDREEARVEFPLTVELSSLTPRRLAEALEHSGCLKVRRVLRPDVVAELVDAIGRAFDGCDRWMADPCSDDVDPWFEPFIPPGGGALHLTRSWLRNGGGLFTGDSPRLANRWFEIVREVGLVDLIQAHFGEAPVTSLDKCALRRIGRGHGEGIEWHQDGSFLGPENRALNVWAALSDTAKAPGLELVNRRFDSVVETGTGGAGYDWSTGAEVVAELSRTTPVVRPHFEPGDLLIFDALLLHRTTPPDPELPDARYAIETWFFRPSAFPSHQEIPLAV